MLQDYAAQDLNPKTPKPQEPHSKHDHHLTFSRFLVLAAMVVLSSVGDVFLSYGMRKTGGLALGDLRHLIPAVFSPWVGVGVIFLMCFFASYSVALSWADLTFVLPASSLAYVMVALLGYFVLHENISPARWTGIFLISCGVGIVARGPIATQRHVPDRGCA
jgi:drug/metabolite transporter (DMT)-like permease